MEVGLVAPSFPALWPALWEVPLLGRTDHQAGTGRNAVVLSSLGELTNRGKPWSDNEWLRAHLEEVAVPDADATRVAVATWVTRPAANRSDVAVSATLAELVLAP